MTEEGKKKKKKKIIWVTCPVCHGKYLQGVWVCPSRVKGKVQKEVHE